MNRSIIRFVNVILAALLAGTSFGIWFGFNPSLLSGAAYIEQHQSLVQSVASLMRIMVIAAATFTTIAAYQQRAHRSNFLLLAGAVFFFVACIVISEFGNRRVDTVVMTWTPLTFPGNWTKYRDQWRFYHGLCTLLEVAALGLVTWASIRRKRILPVQG